MDAVSTLRASIPDFPGYARDLDRRRSDELVRALLGEALAGLSERLGPEVAATTPIDELLLRAQFRNQLAFRAFENAGPDSAGAAAMDEHDARIVELAARAASVTPASAPGYLNEVKQAFDARDRAMQSVPA